MGSLGPLLTCLLNHSRSRWSWIPSPYKGSTYKGVFRLKTTADLGLRLIRTSELRQQIPCSSLSAFTYSSYSLSSDYRTPNPCGCSNKSLLAPNKSLPGPTIIIRGKKSKRRKEKVKEESESSDDDDEEEDEDWKEEAGNDFKDIRTMVPSLRLDTILKAGLNVSRNKLDTAFYDSKIRVNEKKVLKKSKQLEEGDEIDIIKEPSSVNPDLLNISRVIILRVGEYSDDSDKLPVKLRRFKNLLIKKYDDQATED